MMKLVPALSERELKQLVNTIVRRKKREGARTRHPSEPTSARGTTAVGLELSAGLQQQSYHHGATSFCRAGTDAQGVDARTRRSTEHLREPGDEDPERVTQDRGISPRRRVTYSHTEIFQLQCLLYNLNKVYL